MGSKLYEEDRHAWIEHSVKVIQDLGIEVLEDQIEFLQEMSISEKNSIDSHFKRLMHHLLKWQFQKGKRSKSWSTSIITSRSELESIFKHSNSLSNYAKENFKDNYTAAKRLAVSETGMEAKDFPQDCSYTFEQLLDFDFMPD